MVGKGHSQLLGQQNQGHHPAGTAEPGTTAALEPSDEPNCKPGLETALEEKEVLKSKERTTTTCEHH